MKALHVSVSYQTANHVARRFMAANPGSTLNSRQREVTTAFGDSVRFITLGPGYEGLEYDTLWFDEAVDLGDSIVLELRARVRKTEAV